MSNKGRVRAWKPVWPCLPALIWAGLIFLLSHQSKETYDQLGLTGGLLSVCGHLLVYGMLMALLLLALRKSCRLRQQRIYVLAFLLVALYGLSDEYHQSFVPGRTATLIDWLVDLIGAGLAWLIIRRRY